MNIKPIDILRVFQKLKQLLRVKPKMSPAIAFIDLNIIVWLMS